MPTETEDWFSADVLSWRIFGASVWACTIGVGWLITFSFGLQFSENPFEPFGAVISTIGSLLTANSVFHVTLLVACVLQWTRLQAKHTSVTPYVGTSPFSSITRSLQPDLFISFVQFAGFGCLLTWSILKIGTTSFTDLMVRCPEESSVKDASCVNHKHIFLFLAGTFSGFLEGVAFHFQNGNYMNLPIIGLDRYTLVKLKLQTNMLSFGLSAANSMKYFYTLYLFGSILGGGIYRPSGLSYTELISPSLAVSCWLSIFFIKAISVSISSCLSVHCTTPLHMELHNLLQGAASDQPLLALLSLQELSDQTVGRPDVRREVFSLSLPGGHPHTWTSILESTNRYLGSINKDLSELLSPTKKVQIEEIGPNPATPVFSPNMRRLAPNGTNFKQATPVTVRPSFSERLASQWADIQESMKKRPLVGWLVNTPADVAYRKIFARSQAAIFSAEILSHIASSSIKEDSYGIVQKYLPEMLNCLLSLEQNIDRCRGQGIVYRKKTADLPDIHLKQELRCAVKSAIFRIVIAFQEHILAVPVSSEFKQKIKNYQQFLEA